jgi:hypothetical protein
MGNDSPAEPEAFRLLAPQRGLFATDISAVCDGTERTGFRWRDQGSTYTAVDPDQDVKLDARQEPHSILVRLTDPAGAEYKIVAHD